MTPEEELFQANILVQMYPYVIKESGGATINGTKYIWDHKNETMKIASLRKKIGK